MIYKTGIKAAASRTQLREKQAGAVKTAVPAFKRVFIYLIFILILSAPLAGTASANSINTVEIRAVIHSDGSATIEEVWDINITKKSNTEWYVAKRNLDNMDILDLSMQEDKGDSVVRFDTLSAWKKSASRLKKTGKCGLLKANGGYEICWGFGEIGHHKYTVTYTITNIVKGYQGGDAMSFNFLSNMTDDVDSLNIWISSDDFSFEYPATRLWVSGYSATSDFTDGGVTVRGNGRFLKSDSAAILLAFDPGLLSPTDRRAGTLNEIINANMEYSIQENPENNLFDSITSTIIGLCIFVLPMVVAWSVTRKQRKQSKILRKAPYCQELPFEGSLGATYTRLRDINKTNCGSIISCFLLKWIQTGQVEIVNTDYGQATIKLHETKPDMPLFEVSLYQIYIAAAGPDMILRSRGLRNWANKNRLKIESWLMEYRAFYKNELVRMGVYEVVPAKRRSKASEETEYCDTALAKDMTLRAFGFKRYLEDFTRVNERETDEGGVPAAGRPEWPFQSVGEQEARELWDQYLMFAQLFGIADRVVTQQKEFYPYSSYQNDLRYIGGSLYLASIEVSNSFSQAMPQAYSGGGIGGFSGGGGGGGR